MKTLKTILITGAAIATIAAASAIIYCSTREGLPQTTPIGYNVDSKQIEGNVDVKGLSNYIAGEQGEIGKNFANRLDSGEYSTLSLMPMPESEYSAILQMSSDGRGQSLPLNEPETREVLRYFKDFKEGPGADRYVPIAVVGEIVENHSDFPERLEKILNQGAVVDNSCGSAPVRELIQDDNGSIYLRQGNVSVVTDSCSVTSRLPDSTRKALDDLIVKSAQ